MENFIISIPESKKSFFISLLEELKFAKIKSNYTQAEEDEYVNLILQSENDIEEGKLIGTKDLKKEIKKWK